MDENLLAAYNSLIPADRTIVDALVFTLANKDKQITGLCKAVSDHLSQIGSLRQDVIRMQNERTS